MRTLALALIVCLWSSDALAQAPAKKDPPTDVAGITVYPKTDPPKIAASYPAEGQAIAGGVLVMSVTFDQKMLKTGFDLGAAAGTETPQCLKTPRLLDDEKTFVLLCSVGRNTAYGLTFNAAPSGGFASLGDTRAHTATLTFKTNDDGGPNTIREAMKAAKLRDIDMPIQEDPGLTAQAKPAP